MATPLQIDQHLALLVTLMAILGQTKIKFRGVEKMYAIFVLAESYL
jgi:hypothetical protein